MGMENEVLLVLVPKRTLGAGGGIAFLCVVGTPIKCGANCLRRSYKGNAFFMTFINRDANF